MLHKLALLLIIIAGINWALIAILNFNIVTNFFGTGSITNGIYIAFGIAAVLSIRKI